MRAGFTPEVRSALAAAPVFVSRIAFANLFEHFPLFYHEEILDTVGLTLETGIAAKRKRDPAPHPQCLRVPLCGLRVGRAVGQRFDCFGRGTHTLASVGPDTEVNGLALYVLHHKVFDLGAFTVAGGVVLVSDQANGTTVFADTLMILRDGERQAWRFTDLAPSVAFRALSSFSRSV